VIKFLLRLVSFILAIVIVIDFGILLNYFLKDIMERSITDINKASLIFFSLTVILLFSKLFLKRIVNKK